MLRRLLLPALAIGLLVAETASAQTAPATAAAPAPTRKEARQAARAARRTGRVLTNREKRAAAAAKAAATATPALAWGGSNNDPLSETTRATPTNRAEQAWSSAPGMPLNQVGHGVTTDYDGRPIRRPATVANTTLPTVR